MLELYLGRVRGEDAIDRLVDDAIADPALARPTHDDTDLVIGDPITGSIVGIVRSAPAGATDPHDGGLWHSLRLRWTRGWSAT